MENRRKMNGEGVSSPEEECLGMLETLKMTEETTESVLMDEPEDQVIPKGTQEEDKKGNLLDDQWEDFSSPEEEEEMAKQIAEAELALMRKFEKGQEEGRQDPGAPMTPTPKTLPEGRKTPATRNTLANRKIRKEGEEKASNKKKQAMKTTLPSSSSPTPPTSKKKKTNKVITPNNPPKTPAKMTDKTPTMSPAMRKTRTPATKMTPKIQRTFCFSQLTPTPRSSQLAGRRDTRRRWL